MKMKRQVNATTHVIAYLTAAHYEQPDEAARVFADTPDQSLFVSTMAKLFLSFLGGAAEGNGSTVPEILGELGITNAGMDQE